MEQTSEDLRVAEDDTQATWIRITGDSGKTAYSPDLPAGAENLQSTDAWDLPLPIQPESLVAGPRNR